MPPSRSPKPQPAGPSRKLRPWLLGGASVACLVVAVGVSLYLARNEIGVRLAQRYLAERGVSSSIAIERLDARGLVGRLQLGPPDDPDLTVERIEVEFEPLPLFRGGAALPRIASIRMVRPRLKARYDGKRLTFGGLQRLVDEALARPPAPAGPGPRITIEAGEARLDTWAGAATITGDALLDDGRLLKADLKMPAARLAVRPDTVLRVTSASLDAVGDDSRLTGKLELRLAGLDGPTTLSASTLTADVALPYGDGFARLDGLVTARAALTTERMASGGTALRNVSFLASFEGRAAGALNALTLDGSGETAVTATALDAGGAALQRLDARADLLGLHWRTQGSRLDVDRIGFRSAAERGTGSGIALLRPAVSVTLAGTQASFDAGPWRVSAEANGVASAERATHSASTATLPVLTVRAGGDFALAGDGAARWRLAGSARSGRGGLAARDAAVLADGFKLVGDPARIATALRSFELSAPAWSAESRDGGVRLALGQPLLITGAGGIEARVSPSPGKPLLSLASNGRGEGGFTATLDGPGAPKLELAVTDWRAANGATDADTRLALGFTTDLLHETTVSGSGRTRLAGSGLTFTPTGCLAVAAASIGAKEPLATDARARLCAADRTLLTVRDGWNLTGRIEGAAAKLPTSEATVDEGAGTLTMAGRGGRTSGRLQVQRARIVDVAAETRFHPLVATGTLSTEGDEWAGPFVIAEAAQGRPVARALVRQDPDSGSGSAEIEAALAFTPDGLQPRNISPIGADVISEVRGGGLFTGKVAWSGGELVSSGRFTAKDLGFRSMLGQATGAELAIDFDSLIPLTAPPGQRFAAARIAGIAPLSTVSATFSMGEAGMEVKDIQATYASGTLAIPALSVPFEDEPTFTGKLAVAGVDLGELVAASSLADQIKLEARIDGSIPFSIGPAGVRIEDGVMVSVDKGRLSINRAALTGASVTGGAEGAQPNAVQDFAYQALEHLAFDRFDAKIASRPEGRLGAVFHVVGRNDPPGNPRAEVAIEDLIRGTAFDKPINLPKGTPVELTLDTSLNFDDLLKAYGELGQSGSDTVQPNDAQRAP